MRSRFHSRAGFTLLEMLVATVIMGMAVAGLLSNLSTSLRNASRLSDYDQAALLAKRTMDELLLNPRLAKNTVIEGRFDPALTGVEGGWRAMLSNFEEPPRMIPGESVLERLELQVHWASGSRQSNLTLEGFRRTIITAEGTGGS
jgi:type II secretion system protein I